MVWLLLPHWYTCGQVHQEIVEGRLILYKALNLVHFQEETSELEVARYSFIRDNMVDKIEEKNKKDGMWSDGTIQ